MFISTTTFAQFLGGDGDGDVSASTGYTEVNEQTFYCLGGDQGGYMLGFVTSPMNVQLNYCSGGHSDGFNYETTGQLVQFDQSYYCSGGIGDGYVMESTGQVIQFDQSFYCDGGNGDGYNLESSGIVPLSDQSFYCSGGTGDGFDFESTGAVIQFDQGFYCSGGVGDGYELTNLFSTMNDQGFYCLGGNGDGYYMKPSGIIAPNDATFYCSGGDADGYGSKYLNSTMNFQVFYSLGGDGDGSYSVLLSATPNQQNNYCTGGDADGYQFESYSGNIFGFNLFCLGGDGDGYHLEASPTSVLGIGIWNGIASTDWDMNSNWSHNTVPAPEHNVFIPAGCTNYPNVTGSIGINFYTGTVRCSGLTIEQGASLSNSGYLFLAGPMLVEGHYTNTYFKTRSQRVLNGGFLYIAATGNVILGNQTTENGRADLLIYSGGTVYLDGGFLQIDDQMHVRSGGSLFMTGGELLVHKYGEGTAFGSLNPFNFWIEAGAIGEMNAGFLRVVGRETDGIYHAVRIGEPTFLFNGSHTIVFQQGNNPSPFDPDISTADGVSLQNLTINKPGNTVFIKSNLNVKGELKVQSGSSLEVENGYQVSVGQ